MKLGTHEVGPGNPCFIVAELGVNHNGDPETALEMVRAAAKAGADAVKIQCFRAAHFCGPTATYKGESQLEMFKRYELSEDAIRDIASACGEAGVVFFGTPDCLDCAKLLLANGAPCLKVGSDDLTNLPLLRQLANLAVTGLGRVPLILSTGMSSNSEICDALDAMGEYPPPVALLHCVSLYPTDILDANLRMIAELRASLGSVVVGNQEGIVVGYSDHTLGIGAAVGSVWLGAAIVEKHFTLDCSTDGPDHALSADPAQFEAMVEGIADAELLMGRPGQARSPDEWLMRKVARRSIHAARFIPQGTAISETDLVYLRPGTGIAPADADDMIGRVALKDITALDMLTHEMFKRASDAGSES